jgi:hypothetical protein
MRAILYTLEHKEDFGGRTGHNFPGLEISSFSDPLQQYQTKTNMLHQGLLYLVLRWTY